jgi:hypothetical protein
MGGRAVIRTASQGALFASSLALLLAGAARAGDVAWSDYAGERTVVAVTHDEDGDVRETTVWLVVVDGQGYIRTGSTRWGANVERTPQLLLRVASDELPVRVEFVTDEPTRDAVSRAFREKYGFTDRMLSVFRGSAPKIMRLLPGAQGSLPSAVR